jgi:xanthine dehydrogenase accessory factor
MKDLVEIKKFIAARSQEQLILCTLVHKIGSSYRGIGSKKILARDGKSSGLLSGGCLENAIEMKALENFDRLPFVESFSTLADEDRLLGYQTGCKGVIDVLFEKFDFDKINLQIPFGSDAPAWGVRVGLRAPDLGQRSFVDGPSGVALGEESLIEPWLSPLHLVIIGCGADADAYIPFARSLGWSLQFLDYRGDFATPDRFPGEHVEHQKLEKIAGRVPQGPHVAVILMTHNFEADLEILRGLKNHRVGYVGCLGPALRYEKLQNDLKSLYGESLSPHIKSVVSAPIGLFTHSSSPEAIALSVVAQIQEKLVEAPKENTWTMILAAGASKRFGSAKALAEWQGKTLLHQALQTARSISGPATLVVTGGHADLITPHLQEAHSTYNEAWSQGMGTSIAKGISSIRRRDPHAEYVIVLPVDQPLVDANHLKNLVRESKRTGRCVLTAGNNFMGPPAVIPRRLFAQAESLTADHGLKSVLPESEMATVDGVFAARDFDSPQELAGLI